MDKEKRKVLVVDDDRINIKAISEALKYEYRIMAATNADQALRAVRSEAPPDLVLLDIMMPGVDGFEVCRRIKSHPKSRDIPVIFITAMDGDADEARGLAVGAVDYIAKPIVPAIVRARVKVQIELRLHMAALQAAYATIESQRDRMEKELQVGRKLQLSLLPELPRGDSRFSIAASMSPAYEVSGDFYDAFMIDAEHLCFCIGDVSGKGVPAALFMSMCQALVRAKADASLSPARIADDVNLAIVPNNETCMFVTLLVGILNLASGNLRYTNAGHTAPVVRRGGEVIRLPGRHGPAIGVAEIAYLEDSIPLCQGDTLLLYTDGVTEARGSDDQLFGEERLIDHVRHASIDSARSLITSLAAEIETFEQEEGQSDDLTMLAIAFDGLVEQTNVSSHELSMTAREIGRKDPSDMIGDFLDDLAVDVELYNVMYVVLDELVTNIISYGYPGAEKDVEIGIRVQVSGTAATIRVVDTGIQFDPMALEFSDTTASLDQREIGGLGVHLCRQLVDEIAYERRERRNHLTIVKRLSEIEASA